MGNDRDRRPKRLARDTAGQAYPAGVTPTTSDGRPAGIGESVASRSTEEEARDLLALRRAKRGDTGAFADLLQANDRDVRSLLAALVGPDDLDVVCTQVYLRAFRGLPIAPSTSPRIWLLGIADGAARDAVRRIRQSPGADRPATAPIPIDRPPEERLVVAAIDAVGLTPRETARLIDGGIESVRELLTEGRARPGVVMPFDPPPEHAGRFWDDLGRRLLMEQSAPAASRRHQDPAGRRSAVGDDDLAPTPQTLDVVRGMAVRVEQQHPRVIPWRRIATALAVVVTVAVFIGVALTIAGHASRRDAGLGDTAAKTLDRLDAALARNTVVRGTVTITGGASDAVTPGTYRFVRSNIGSWRTTALDSSVDEGYDVAHATAASVQRRGGTQVVAAQVRSGLAPGPPEATGDAQHGPGDVLANVIRTVRAGSAGEVETRSVPVAPSGSSGPTGSSGSTQQPTTTEARSVWVVTSRLDGPVGSSGLAGTGGLGEVDADEAELVADQSLALPTHLTLRRNGVTVLSVRFTGLSISQQATAMPYTPTVLAGVQATTTDSGFIPTPAGDLAGASAGPPATPSFLPGGYVLASAGVNRAQRTTVVCYRNGSRQLVLTVRPAPSTASDPADPFAGASPSHAGADRVSIGSGSFAGRDAYSSRDVVRHVWVNGPRTQVIAAGDPTVAELTKVLASLR